MSCPCRDCRSRDDYGLIFPSALFSPDARARIVSDAYVRQTESPFRDGSKLERELDEVMGVRHARFQAGLPDRSVFAVGGGV